MEGLDQHTVGGAWVPSMQFSKAAEGMEYLGGAETKGGVDQIFGVSFRPRDVLFVIGRVSSTSAASILAMRFNNDASLSYWARSLEAAAGSSTWSETAAVTNTTHVRVSSASTTAARTFMAIILNRPTSTKSVIVESSQATGSAATVGPLQIGSGEWVNTTSNISTIEIAASAGTTFGADTGFGVFGKDLGP